MATRSSRKPRCKLTNDAKIVLSSFLDFAEQGQGSLVAYIQHCGIVGGDDDTDGQTPRDLIIGHYVLPDGSYDIGLASRDLMRWPPIANRMREAKRETQKISSKS